MELIKDMLNGAEPSVNDLVQEIMSTPQTPEIAVADKS
jgi:hypothetical protein